MKVFDYRGLKILDVFNKKSSRREFKVRFQINKKRRSLVADTRADLETMIDEILLTARRSKHDLPTARADRSPTLKDLFARILPTVEKPHQRKLCERVFENFLALLPVAVLVKDLRKNHFQIYIDWRKTQQGIQTKKPLKTESIYKELYAVSNALKKGELYFESLENWEVPKLPKFDKKKSEKLSRRTRIVSPEDELKILLEELRHPTGGRITIATRNHSARIADELEFKAETGLRRKEVARLQVKQFLTNEKALKDVRRWKTGTVTKFYPLSFRASEIIERRIKDKTLTASDYIFSVNGEAGDGDYRTLKAVCKRLEIPYGRFNEDGFIPHDLRHNFASDVIQHTDIETTRELLGHSNITQTGQYLHTTKERLRQAVKNRQGIDLKSEIVAIYKKTRRKKIKAKAFVKLIEDLLKSG